MRLGALTGGDEQQRITGFAIDHRKVAPGTVFGAFQGLQVNGESFIPAAVTAGAVAEAHKRDLAAQAKHQVKYLNYWFDADSGTVMCLTEAASAAAALAVHAEAHGLMPASIDEVSEGR